MIGKWVRTCVCAATLALTSWGVGGASVAEASDKPAPLRSLASPDIAASGGSRVRLEEDSRTRRHLTFLVLAAVGAVVTVIGWNVVLRRRVDFRTAELRETELRFAAILNSLPEFAWIKDAEGRYLTVNRSLSRLCGKDDPDKIIGLTDFDLFAQDIAETYCRNDQAVIRRKAALVVVEPFAESDGTIRWLESTKAPLLDAWGRCSGTVGLSRDITSRKYAEDGLSLALESLRASESRYRDMVSALPVGVYETDNSGNVIFANDIARGFWETGEAPDGEPWVTFIHPDDRVAVTMAFRNLLTTGEPIDLETRMVRGHAQPTWVAILGVRRSDTGGAILSIQDISERHLAAERLRAHKEEFRALAELSPDTIARYDGECRRLYANPAFARAAGVPVELLLGKTPSQAPSTSHQMQAYEEKIRQVYQTGCEGWFELTWVGCHGQEIISDIRLVPSRGSDGTVASVIAVGRDVSELKAVERKLQRKSDQLSALVANIPGNSFTMRYRLDGRKSLIYSDTPLGDRPAPQDVSEEEFRSQFHPDDHHLLFEEVPRRLKLTGFSDHRFRFLQRDGGVIWLHSRERVREWQGTDMIVDGLVFDVTEEMDAKVKLEQTARELETTVRRFETLVDNLPGLAYRKEYDATSSRIVYVSRGFKRLMGYDFEGGSDQDRLARIWHPEDHHKVTGYGASIRDGAPSAEATLRFFHADGSVRWVLLRERVVERREGWVAAEGMMFDITEEMVAKQGLEAKADELRSAVQRVGAILDNLPGLAYRKEYGPTNSHVTYTSGGFRTVFGREFDRDLDDDGRMAVIWHPDDHDKVKSYSRSIRDGAEYAEVKLRFLHPSGSIRWVLVRERVVERLGDAVAAEGLLIDITEEMQAKDALEQSAEQLWLAAGKLQTLLSNLPGQIFRMEYLPDGSRRVLEVFGEAFTPGYDLHSADGLKAVIHPDDIDAMFVDLAARLRADGAAEQTFRLRGADGRYIWCQTREKVVERLGDRMIVEGQVIDITAEVLMRQDLEESEARLRRAESRLERGLRFEALGQFAGGVAHDFNNLLGAILGYARFIEEDTPPTSDSHRHAKRIIAAGTKGHGIVAQILDYSRQGEMAPSYFSVGELISDVATMCAVADHPGIAFVPDLTLADTKIEADRVQLSRMLMNLCINARDAIGSQDGTIFIGAHQAEFDADVLHRLIERDQGGDGGDVEAWTDSGGYSWVVAGRLPKVLPHVALYVADTGVGMDDKLFQHAFTPFFTTKDRSKGTGLGMAVVLGIVIAHGGALVGRSRPGEGTRFDVLLPVSRSAVEAVKEFVPIEAPPQTRIMVVDDNIDVLDSMTEALKRVDYLAEGFSEPRQALEAFRDDPDAWDLVITDQIMPAIRGIDLVKKLHEIRPDVPCLLCSGYAEELNQAACREAGVVEFLRKPLGFRDLVRAINGLTSKKTTEG